MSTLIQPIGKRAYAFGVDWRDVDADDVRDAIEEAQSQEGTFWTVQRKDRKGPARIGTAVIPKGEKGKVYPFAMVVAGSGNDGVFVVPLPGGQWWYVSVAGGLVVAGTDRVGEQSQVMEAIRTIVVLAERSGEKRTVYAPLEFRQPGWQVYDPKEMADRAKVKPLQRSAQATPAQAAAVLAMLAGAGLAAWWFLFRGPSPAEQAAMDAEAARVAYVTTLTTQLAGLPADAHWTGAVLPLVRESAPAFAGGYTLREVQCQPSNCLLRYEVVQRDSPFSPEALKAAAPGLSLDPGGLAATLSIPLNTATINVDDAMLRNWPSSPDRTTVLLGTLPIYAPNLILEREPIPEDMTAMAGGILPEGYLPITRTVLPLRAREAQPVVAGEVAALSSYWAEGGFVPTSLRWTTGLDGQPATWSMEFTRVSGPSP